MEDFNPSASQQDSGSTSCRSIYFFSLRDSGTAGAIVEDPSNITFFQLRDCETTGALVLDPFNIPFYYRATVGLHEH